MQPQLYPSELAEHSLEVHLARHSQRSQAIYIVVVLALLAAFAALPFLRVNVSVQSPGLIRPVTEKHEINARAAGFADAIRVRENQVVQKGEVLLALRPGPLDQRAELVATQIAEKQRAVRDLERLTRADPSLSLDPSAFQTAQHGQEYVQFVSEVRENRLRQEQAGKKLERARVLYERELGPRSEVEDGEFQLGQLRSEEALLTERRVSGWQSALTANRMELRELQAQSGQLEEERALYTIRAPVTGTIEQLASISPGSYVQPGERLAVISPSSELVGEVYVTPRDIGLLRTGTPVRMQIDAFNYNDWGFVTGRVTQISDDFILLDQQPVFRVETDLDQGHLALRNGFRGRLKKGMTLRARFLVTERTLFQLLRDDINDWLNPAGGSA